MAGAVLVGLVLSLQFLSGNALGAPLTEWQQQVFNEVAKSAAVQSKAAEPELLALFDSEEFRANLSACCPSFAKMSAAELMDRLSKQFQVAEVASGFPAFQDPAELFPDSAGMSIDFGMNGTFFLSDWQAILMHSTVDPEKVWHGLVSTYQAFHVNSSRGTVTMEQWLGGCTGNKSQPVEMLLSTCYVEPHSFKGQDRIVRYDYEQGTGHINNSFWLASSSSKIVGGRSSPSLELDLGMQKVDCPKRPAFAISVYVADGQCHSHAVQNNSQEFGYQDHAETYEYGLKPFKSRGAPSTLAEAAERPVYSLVNLNMIDMGSPIYGDVSAIFSNKYIADSTLLSPVDSGMYEMNCIDKEDFEWAPRHNCSAVTAFKHLGTLRHHKHLWLINQDFWNRVGLLHTALTRMETPWGRHAVPAGRFLNYFEGALLGQLQFPTAIRFLLGCFPALFGTDLGVKLQTWARSRGWVLIWALGPNDKAIVGETSDFNLDLMAGTLSFEVNKRLIDPLVLSETTAAASLSLGSNATDKFHRMWAEVAHLRNTTNVTNATMAQKMQEIGTLLPQLPIRPLMAGDCDAQLKSAECVGMTLQGSCLCYASVDPHMQVVSEAEVFV